jgi:hypothetical protein
MADTPSSPTPSAAPAAQAAAPSAQQASKSPVDAATEQVLKTLPQEPKKKSNPAQAAIAEMQGELEDSGEEFDGEEEATPAEKKKAEAAARKAYKLKVGGKDVEVDEAELLKRAQMGYSADEKWQEASRMRKQMEGFVQLMQRDPAKALEQMGFDVDKLAEERIQRRIEEMQKSPEQIEREKIQRELEELKAEREAERTEAQEREKQRLQEQYAIEIENDISSALDDNKFGVPKSPYVVKRIADTMILAVQEGIRTNNSKLKNITAKDVLPIVQEEIKNELAEMYSIAPDDVFEQLVGKDRLNKYRKAKIKKPGVKPQSAADVKSTGAAELNRAQEEQNREKKKVSAKDFFKTLGSGKV